VLESLDFLYLVPEMGRKQFLKVARYFGLNRFGKRFRHRTMKDGPVIMLNDPQLLKVVAGKILFLDTLDYFSEIDDPNNPNQWLWICGAAS
jgi:hypothetical protein